MSEAPWWAVLIVAPVLTICFIAIFWFWMWLGDFVEAPWDIWMRRRKR